MFDPLTLDTPWASGCCLLVPAPVFRGIGGFDESIGLAIDYDLWLRIAMNYRFDYVDAPLVKQHMPADSSQTKAGSAQRPHRTA